MKYLIIILVLLTGCIERDPPYSPPPVAVAEAPDTAHLGQAIAFLNGSSEGDSIVSTLWVRLGTDSSNSDDVTIESPDSLKSRVFIKYPGSYRFALYVQDSSGNMDSSSMLISVIGDTTKQKQP